MTTTPRDLLIDPITGDLALIDGAAQWASGDALVRQRVGIRLRTQVGEWAYDQGMGLPYFERILVKSPDVRLIRALIVAEVGRAAGVLAVTRADVTFSRAQRRLTATIHAKTTSGTIREEIVTP
jgi:hypothetical protein